MKRFLFIMLVLLICGFGILQIVKEKVGNDIAQPVNDPILTPSPTVIIDRNQQANTSLFVPYWTIPNGKNEENTISSTYDAYIYFGVTPTDDGIVDAEEGTDAIASFQKAVPQEKKTILTLRMIDTKKNAKILQDKTLQKKIVAQTIEFANTHGFSGVMLDLEMSALPFDSLVNQINTFTALLSQQAKENNLQFSSILSGDTLYRVRPFDVTSLAKSADSVFIMAYDFHKARGNPGPNLPINGKETYGYDLTTMADDFLQKVPNKKLHIIFGLFGYDWQVDEQGKAIAQGEPLTYLQIQNKFLQHCAYKECHWERNSVSAETKITYTDDNNQKHIVWFEDPQSIKTKQAMLQKKGIVNFSFWANSYF
jgi:spore germination protein YaaH